MAKIENQLNELNGVPAIIGGGTMSTNGAEATNPTFNQLSSYENGTMGGAESIGNGGRMYMDWISGKGPYGEKGRDHAFAMSSLAIVNPYAAAAVLGVMAGSAVIYGICTSAYVRARNAQRRLRDIYNGVKGDGYKLESTGFGILGLWSNKGEKFGHLQFRKQIDDDVKQIMETINKNSLDTSHYRTTLSNRADRDKLESVISHILSESYKKIYLPKKASESINSEVEQLKATDPAEYAKALREKMRYGTKSEKTYSQIVTEMAEKGVNAPVYNQANEYIKTIQQAGDDVIKDYQTKMAYALKKGGNRATAAKNKLIILWKKYMKDISEEIYKEVSNFLSEDPYKDFKINIDALYNVSALPFNQAVFDGDVNIEDLWMTYSGGSGTPQQPVLMKVLQTDAITKMVTMVVCNTDIIGKPILYNITADDLKDRQERGEWRKMRINGRSSVGSNTVGRIYRINYQYTKMDAYIIVEKFDPSTGVIMFHYFNSYIPSISWGPYQRTQKLTPNAILGEVVEMGLKESVSEPFYTEFNRLFEEKLFEAPQDTSANQDPSANADEPKSEDVAEIVTKLKDSVFVDKGVYMIVADKDRRLVRTGDSLPGKVDVIGDKIYTIEEWAKLDPMEIPEMEDAIEKRGDILDMNMSLNPSEVKTYKDFGERYLDGRYEIIVSSVLDKHKKELNTYSVDYDNVKKYVKLLNTRGETTTSMLSDMGSFRKYIVDGIGKETYGKPLDYNPIEKANVDASTSDASTADSSTSESLSVRYGRMITESAYAKNLVTTYFIAEAGATQDNSKNKTTNTQKNTTQTTNVGGDQTNVTQDVRNTKTTDKSVNVSGDQVSNSSTAIGGDFIAKLCAEHVDMSTKNQAYITVVNNYGDTPDAQEGGNGYVNGNSGEQEGGSDKGEEKPKKKFDTVDEIPSFIPTICEEIRKFIDSFNDMMEKGKTRGALRSAPGVFAVNEEKWNKLISTDKASNKVDLKQNTSKKLNDEYEHKDGEIIIYLHKLEGDKEKTYSFTVDNYTIDLKCDVSDIEGCDLRVAYRKDSDESHVSDDIRCGFNDGNVYALNSEELSKLGKTEGKENQEQEEQQPVQDSLQEYYDKMFKIFESGYDEQLYEADGDDENNEVEDKGLDYDYVVLTKTDYKEKKIKLIHYDTSKAIKEDYIGSDVNSFISKLEPSFELPFEQSGKLSAIKINSFTDFLDTEDSNLLDGKFYSVDEEYFKDILEHFFDDKSVSYAKMPVRFDGDGEDGKSAIILIGVGAREKKLTIPYILMDDKKFKVLDVNTDKFQKGKCYEVTKEYIDDTPVIKKILDDSGANDGYTSMVLRQTEDITNGYDLKFEVAVIKSESIEVFPDENKSYDVNFFEINPDAFIEVEDKFGENGGEKKDFKDLEKGDTFEVSEEEFNESFMKSEGEKKEESAWYAYRQAMRLYEADGDKPAMIKLTVLERTDDELKVARDNGDVYTISKEKYEALKSIKHGEKVSTSSDEDTLKISSDKHFITDDNAKKLTELRAIAENLKASDPNGEKLAKVLSSNTYANTNISTPDRVMNKLGMSGLPKGNGNVYDYLILIIDSLLNKNMPAVDANKERTITYFDADGKIANKKIKLTDIKPDGLHVTDVSDNKAYLISMKDVNNILITESHKERVTYDYVKLMKYNLYGTPLNEAIVINCDARFLTDLLSVLIGYQGEGKIENANCLLNVLPNVAKGEENAQEQPNKEEPAQQQQPQHKPNQQQPQQSQDAPQQTTDASGNFKTQVPVAGDMTMDITAHKI